MLYVFVCNPVNPAETWEIPTESVKWTEELNAVKTGQFSVNYKSLQELAATTGTSVNYILTGSPREVRITDTGYSDDPLLWRGVLRDYQFSSNATETSSVSLNFADLGIILSKRVGSEYAFYDQVQAGQIFQTELTKANAISDTGLSMGELPATTKRQRTIEYTNLLDLLTGMSNAKTKDGFDFDVDKYGKINVYQPRGENQSNIVFDTRNSMQPQVSGKLKGQLCNKVYVQGGELTDENGNVTQEAQLVIVEDTASQGKWGLHEEYLSATDIATEPFLRQRGEQVLAERAYPTKTESITLNHLGDDPDWRSYNTGDWVRVELPDLGLDEMLRVKKRSITWTNGVYQAELNLSREEG